MKHAGGLWPLIPFLLAMIFFAGLYRLVEVAASLALAAAGMPDSGWAAVAGLAAVAAVGSILGYKWWQARRYGQYSYIRDLTGEDVALTPEQLKEIAEGREQLEQEGSPLRQVVPIGRTISADTMTVDAIALEIREAGGRMTLVVHDPVAAEEERQLQGRMSTMREPSADDWPMPCDRSSACRTTPERPTSPGKVVPAVQAELCATRSASRQRLRPPQRRSRSLSSA